MWKFILFLVIVFMVIRVMLILFVKDLDKLIDLVVEFVNKNICLYFVKFNLFNLFRFL